MKIAILLIAASAALLSGCETNPSRRSPEEQRADQQQFMNGLMLMQQGQARSNYQRQPLNMGKSCVSRRQYDGSVYTTCD